MISIAVTRTLSCSLNFKEQSLFVRSRICMENNWKKGPYTDITLHTTDCRLWTRTFFPWQILQRSLGLILSPWPRHSPHIDWICWIMPGPSCWIWTCIPVPLHVGHCSTAPFLPPRPAALMSAVKVTVLTRSPFYLRMNSSTFFRFALHLNTLQVNAAEFFGILYYFPFADVHAIGSSKIKNF